jgi:hypothetical protein
MELQSTDRSARKPQQSKTTKSESRQASMWLRLGPALARMNYLQSVCVWLGHDDPEYWWEFNEQAILSLLFSLEKNPSVNLGINLSSHAAHKFPYRCSILHAGSGRLVMDLE